MAFAQLKSENRTKAGRESCKHEAIQSIHSYMIVRKSDLPTHQVYVPN